MITFGRNSSSRLFHNPKDPFISMVSFWHCQPNIYRILTHIIYHLWRFWTMFGHFWLWSIFNRIKDGIELAYLTKIQQFVLYWTICSVCLVQYSLNSSQWNWTSNIFDPSKWTVRWSKWTVQLEPSDTGLSSFIGHFTLT